MNVNDIFKQLESTSSRLEKEAILLKNKNNRDLKRAVFLALDPFTQFYIRKIPIYIKKPVQYSLSEAMDKLSDLSSRKVTGHAGIDHLTNILQFLSIDDAEVIKRIVQKDLDCGVQESTANKIWENLIPSYPCMLASAFDQKLVDKVKFPAFVQLKMDGMRFNAIVDAHNDTVTYRSRNGKPLSINSKKLDKVFQDMASNVGMGKVVFDGELLVVDEKEVPLDRKTGNGILNKATKGTISEDEVAQVRAILWDLIPFAYFEKGKCDVDYQTRLTTLTTAVEYVFGGHELVSVVKTNVAKSLEEAQELFETYLGLGEEGIILKTFDGIWEDKRAKHQIKFKGELECDLICTAWVPHTKDKKLLGSVELESSDGKIKVSCGSGFTLKQRETLKEKDVVGKVIAVKYNARINSKNKEADSLFLPIFIEIREDKSKADSSKSIK